LGAVNARLVFILPHCFQCKIRILRPKQWRSTDLTAMFIHKRDQYNTETDEH